MMASRGMGDIAPSKMPGAKTKARRDDTDFTQYKEGGKVKSKVNAAGNYTKPDLRKRIFNSVKAAAIVGTGAGQWSARKAQVMAKRYKAAGGGYRD
jgi:putative N-acetylmannosamine-6-phosphate epimerase